MAVAPITTPEQEAPVRRAPVRRRTRLGGRRGPRAEDGNPREIPPIVAVYFHTDGELHHGWCGHPLEFHGTRAGQELRRVRDDLILRRGGPARRCAREGI